MAADPDLRLKVLRTTLEEAQASNQDERFQDPCVICLEFVSEKAVAVPCNHQSFDFICLVSWLQENSWCPLCKSEVSRVKYDFSADGSCKTFDVSSTRGPKVQDLPNDAAHTPASWILQSRPGPRYLGSRGRPRSQRYRPGGRKESPASLDQGLQRRRYIYQHRLYSAHVGSNQISRFQDLTPGHFNSDPELVSRARKWIRRELRVFDFLGAASPQSPKDPGHPSTPPSPGDIVKSQTRAERALRRRRASNAEFLLEYILAILKTVDVKGSQGQAEQMLSEFLGRENARLFLHELRAWLRSPYADLENWDRHVQYPDLRDAAGASLSVGDGGLVKMQVGEKRRRRSSDEIAGSDAVRGRSKRLGRDRYVPD